MPRRTEVFKVKEFTADLRKEFVAAARVAAKDIMNDLAEAGPYWSGRLRDSWRAEPLLATERAGNKNASYPYKTQDVPQLRSVSKGFRVGDLYRIYNTTPYAAFALDLIPGKFRAVGSPLGSVTSLPGKRPAEAHFRYEVESVDEGEESEASITAPRDWFETYKRSRKADTRLQRAVNVATAGSIIESTAEATGV